MAEKIAQALIDLDRMQLVLDPVPGTARVQRALERSISELQASLRAILEPDIRATSAAWRGSREELIEIRRSWAVETPRSVEGVLERTKMMAAVDLLLEE